MLKQKGIWNLVNIENQNFSIIHIKPKFLKNEATDSEIFKRLDIFSHYLSSSGVPSFFIKNALSINGVLNNDNGIISFDIYTKISECSIPKWLEIAKIIQYSQEIISDKFFEVFQQSLSMYYTYLYNENSPMYFTSFVYFSSFNGFSESVALYPTPIMKNGQLFLRLSFYTFLFSYILENSSPKPGVFILLSPHEYPFYVLGHSEGKTSLYSLDRNIYHIDLSCSTFIVLTQPPPSLFRLCSLGSNENSSTPLLGSFLTYQFPDFFDFSGKDIDTFFQNLVHTCFNDDSKSTYNDQIAFRESSIFGFINEIVHNPEQKCLLSQVYKFIIDMDITKFVLSLPKTSFISCYSTDLSTTTSYFPNIDISNFGFRQFDLQRIGIPRALVIKDTNPTLIGANIVVSQWIEDRIFPISGPKNVYYVAFLVDSSKSEKAQCFLNDISSMFSQMCLGSISQHSNFNSLVLSTTDSIKRDVKAFFEKISQVEFQQVQTICIIIHPITFDLEIEEHTITTYIPEAYIENPCYSYIQNLSFQIYSRIREFCPWPYGMFMIGPSEISALFFGFRYQPPFFVNTDDSNSSKELHIAWDPQTKYSAWTNSTGSVSHICRPTSFSGIISSLKSVYGQLRSPPFSVFFCIVGEGITQDVNDEIMNYSDTDIEELIIFSSYPAPQIQTLTFEPFDGDYLSFCDIEFTCFDKINQIAQPISSGYVISPQLTSYSICLYRHGNPEQKDMLIQVASKISSLSWLSANSSKQKRMNSLPPHISALLRKARKPTSVLTRCAFLPITNM